MPAVPTHVGEPSSSACRSIGQGAVSTHVGVNCGWRKNWGRRFCHRGTRGGELHGSRLLCCEGFDGAMPVGRGGNWRVVLAFPVNSPPVRLFPMVAEPFVRNAPELGRWLTLSRHVARSRFPDGPLELPGQCRPRDQSPRRFPRTAPLIPRSAGTEPKPLPLPRQGRRR